jgi:hypothetical protein
MSRVPSLALAILFASFPGCTQNSSRQVSTIPSQPIVQLGQLAIEGPLGHSYKISSPEVEQYVRDFGLQGWLVGLTDGRITDEAHRAWTPVPMEQAGGGHVPFTVSDLFLYHYLREHSDLARGMRFDSEQERNAGKREALKRVRAELKSITARDANSPVDSRQSDR